MDDLRNSLIADVCGEKGPLPLIRSYCRNHIEEPESDIPDRIARLVEPGSAARGADLVGSLAERHIKLITLLDPTYPLMLKQIADPPLVLFYSGECQALHRPAVGIVGSRKAGTYGRQVARQLAGELARLGFVIASGLAHGIDARAHTACLDVEGRTVAVLGSGIDTIYPRDHRDLGRRIVLGGGAVISEMPPGTPPKPFHFPIRNRIISGLSHAVIVVEAQPRSGSLVTARHCLEQGRELFAVPGPINQPGSQGTNQLIAKGEAQLVLSLESILEHLGPILGLAAQHQARLEAVIEHPLSKKIYERLDAFEPLPLDLLVAELGEETGVLLARLVELEARNLVERRPGHLYVRNPLQL